ncbi:MAG TPA: hypothetical protein VGN76_12835 [Gemmatimonadales bacterium]|nr:hypothetical protein [Gemmatimonadales bacterium]
MHHRVLWAGALLLAGCSQTLATPITAKTSAGPDATFDCVKQQLKELGYKQSSIDEDARRIIATKIDEKTRRPDTQFNRIRNRIEVEVAPQADGQTSIQVKGRTFAEYTTQRGPTEVEEKASDEVRAAQQQVAERCRS